MKLSKKSGLSFFGLAVLITAMTFALINNSNTNLAYSGLSTDPSNIPVPEFDFDDPARAMVVTVFFNSESDVIFESAQVSSGPAPAHIGNPAMIVTQTFDVDGVLMGEFNSWHPLFVEHENVDGTYSFVTLDSGPGKFIVPFEPTLDSLMIVDVELNEELISVELAAPIRAFCQDNPEHPDCLKADLVIDSVEVTDSPAFVLVGESADVTIQTVMKNNGPSSPLDTIFSQIVTFPSGVLATPAEITEEEGSLSGVDRQNDNTYSVQCLEPGSHTLVITSTIDAKQAAVSDPDLLNNEKIIEHVVDCAIPILVDIKPGSDPSSVNCKNLKGNVPVAIFTDDNFDAIEIEIVSMQLQGTPVIEVHNQLHPEDVDGDGDLDAVVHLGKAEVCDATSDLPLKESAEVKLTGQTIDGTLFEGIGDIRIVKR